MMKKEIFCSFIWLILLFANVLISQEIQVPMDQEGKVNYIDSVLNNKIGVFDNYSGFIEARLFKLTDSTFSLEIYYMIDEKFNRHRNKLNLNEVDTLRSKVSLKLKNNISTTINQEGRAELLWGLTLAGLSIYGPAAIITTNAAGNGTTGTGLYMLTAAASFLIPYAITNNTPVSDGAARLSLWGAYSGALHGLLLNYLLGLETTTTYGDPPYQYSYTSSDEKTIWGLMALTSIVEAFAGYSIAQNNDFSEGKSDLMVNSSIACSGALPGLLYLAGGENSKAFYASTLLGTFSGYVLGNYISNTQNYSRGDAMCFTNSWILGAMIPVSLLASAKIDEPKLYIASAILGAGLGMMVGNNLVTGKDFSTSQGVYMSLGSFGGSFVMGGITLLLISNSGSGGEIIPVMITLGAVAGFALTYSAFADDPKIKEKNLSSDFKIDFNPLALTSAFSKGIEFNKMNFNQVYYYNPILSITYKF
jgi:hypothetical protein